MDNATKGPTTAKQKRDWWRLRESLDERMGQVVNQMEVRCSIYLETHSCVYIRFACYVSFL